MRISIVLAGKKLGKKIEMNKKPQYFCKKCKADIPEN
jgi:hypothetical protein